MVQCLGVRMGEIGDKVCLTGYHRLVSEMELLQFSTESKAEEKRALQENRVEFLGKIYMEKCILLCSAFGNGCVRRGRTG